jgi:hypothetical protein
MRLMHVIKSYDLGLYECEDFNLIEMLL